ncbi:hypothetical protein A2U01_0043284, partial [Trifolium medium]|nr:hypothetical protein [Trifolium medium]
MRERGRSRARSASHGQLHRSSSPLGCSNWVGRDPSRGPDIGGERGDWQDVMPRWRKASRQVDRSQDRQSRFKRHGGERSWSTGTGRGCYRDGYRFRDGFHRSRVRGASRIRCCDYPSARY